MQFMMYDPVLFDPNGEIAMPTPETMAEMGAFVDKGIKSGTVIATGALQPKGVRLKLAEGKFTVTDGPFVELKELLAGFAVLQAASLEEAIEWSKGFLKIMGRGEYEIVQLMTQGDLPQME